MMLVLFTMAGAFLGGIAVATLLNRVCTTAPSDPSAAASGPTAAAAAAAAAAAFAAVATLVFYLVRTGDLSAGLGALVAVATLIALAVVSRALR